VATNKAFFANEAGRLHGPRPAHSAYWAQCEECEVRTRELEAAGCTRSDAQAVAEGEHMLANCRREGA
jgi:hypothetical protein